jgi:hypothetical protein
MSTAFFNPTSPFGALTGWEIQTNNPTTSVTRAQALGSAGDELASKLHDTRTSVSATYVLQTATGCKIPKFGEILGGYHVDTVSISFSNTAFVTMTVTGHKHGSGEHPACRTYTGSLTTIASNFGCTSTVVGMTIPQDAGVRTMTYTLQGNHQDELGSAGEFLAADNYDGNETVDVELCDSGTIAAITGWDMTSTNSAFANNAAQTASATVEKHLQHDS